MKPTSPSRKLKLVGSIDPPELVAHVNAIRALGKQTIANVIEIGKHLTECKRIVGHGNFEAWLKREFDWKESTAFRFMRVYALAGKSANLTDLNLPVSSLYLLAAPSTPEKVRDEIIERAEAGEKIKGTDIKAAIKGQPDARREEGEDDMETCPTCAGTGECSNCHGEAGTKVLPQEKKAKLTNPEEMPDQETLYDQACLLLGLMTNETRQRFFASFCKKRVEAALAAWVAADKALCDAQRKRPLGQARTKEHRKLASLASSAGIEEYYARNKVIALLNPDDHKHARGARK